MPGWRRGWDSNPRYAFTYTRFPSVRLKPLGPLSGRRLLEGRGRFFKAEVWFQPAIAQRRQEPLSLPPPPADQRFHQSREAGWIGAHHHDHDRGEEDQAPLAVGLQVGRKEIDRRRGQHGPDEMAEPA